MKDHMRVERSSTISELPSFPENVALRVRPLRLVGFIVLCGAMTALGALTVAVAKNLSGKTIGVICVAFFGFGLLLFCYLAIVRPVWLRLNADGFDYRGKAMAWSQVRQVSGFGVTGMTFVSVRGTGGFAPGEPTRRAASSVLILASALMPYRRLADLLLNYKATWDDAQQELYR